MKKKLFTKQVVGGINQGYILCLLINHQLGIINFEKIWNQWIASTRGLFRLVMVYKIVFILIILIYLIKFFINLFINLEWGRTDLKGTWRLFIYWSYKALAWNRKKCITKYFTGYKKSIRKSIPIYRYGTKDGFAKSSSPSEGIISYFNESIKIKVKQKEGRNKWQEKRSKLNFLLNLFI